MNKALSLLAAVAVALTVTTGPLAAQSIANIGWKIEHSESARSPGRVQLSLRYDDDGRGSNNWSQGYALEELRGLTATQLAAPTAGPVRFALVREAGRFDCDGVAGALGGTGRCGFAADSGFAARLAAHGVGRPTARQSYSLALGNVSSATLDELKRQSYPLPTIDGLVAFGVHRVTPDYIRSLADAGYRLTAADDLVAFRIHRVDADFVRGFAALGPQYRAIAGDDLVTFRIHRVTPELVRAYTRLGVRDLDRNDLTSMAIHRVTPEFIQELAELGLRDISASQLVTMRIHGVTPAYIRAIRGQGMVRLSPEQLVTMKITGLRPGRRTTR